MGLQQIPSKGGIPSGNTASRPGSPVIGDTYYNGTLEILEIYNGTQWVAASAPPATPTITSVTDVGTNLAYTTGGTFTVVVAPGEGGATATQYNASTSVGGFSGSSSSTTISLTGLTSNTSFIVVSSAQNNFGTTVNSNPFSAVLATTKPQVPTIGTATAAAAAEEITVTWTLGNNGGKALSAITITPYLNGTTAGTARTAATTSSTSYTFTSGQLTAGSSYTFKVKATNANGDSPESSASNSATVPSLVSINYLVVGGGGGGAAGGGGAGGLRSTVTNTGGGGTLESAVNLTKGTNYTVTIGAGAAGGIAYGGGAANGDKGTDSVFSTITSLGGGGGGAAGGGTGQPTTGGSGGGASYSSGTGIKGLGTAGQGYDGGEDVQDAAPYVGPGGGGASQTGRTAPNSTTAGAGGDGVAVAITGSSVTYAGGGGGWGYGGASAGGAGGAGGGGTAAAGNGTANTGGGGAATSNGGQGGTGGSGVVILRWLTSAGSITVGAGLTADSTGTDGSYSYKRFTAGSGNVSFA